MSMKVIFNIFGPSTAGKSTTAELLEPEFERLYTVDFDVIKRQLSGYHWKRDSATAQKITFDTLASVAATGLTILALLPPPKAEGDYNRLVAIAEINNYTVINIEISAPEEVLVQRYKARLRAIRESGSNWKFKTLDEFKNKLHESYYRPANTISFDSSEMSPDSILEAIKERVANL